MANDSRIQGLQNLGYDSASVEKFAGDCLKKSIEDVLSSYDQKYNSLSSKQKELEERASYYQKEIDSKKERYESLKTKLDAGEKIGFWDKMYMHKYRGLEGKLTKAKERRDNQKTKAEEYKAMLDSVKGITTTLSDYDSLESTIIEQKKTYKNMRNPKSNKNGAVGGILGGLIGFVAGAFLGPLAPFIWAATGATMGYVAGNEYSQTKESLVERSKLDILKDIRSVYHNSLQSAYETVYYGGKIDGLKKSEKPKEAKATVSTPSSAPPAPPGKSGTPIAPGSPAPLGTSS